MGESPNPIEIELAAEKAAALGRSGKLLRAALEKLRQFDAASPQSRAGVDATARTELIERAGEAFWSYIVQREVLGLYDEEAIARDYDVPGEVRSHMGPRVRNPRR
jgi:hypothetical protein